MPLLVLDLGVDRPEAVVRVELLLCDFDLRKLGLREIEELLFAVDFLGGLEALFQRVAQVLDFLDISGDGVDLATGFVGLDLGGGWVVRIKSNRL